jgi:hypothetical protein
MSSIDAWKERRRRERESRRRSIAAIAVWLFVVVLIGVGSGIGSYCYLMINDDKNAKIVSEVGRAVGFAIIGGSLGFAAVLGIIAKTGFGAVIWGGEPNAVPKRPWRAAAIVGLLAAIGLSALECADQGAQFDWSIFGSSLAGALPALGIAWMAIRALVGFGLLANQGRGRSPW